jgi:hypothetical protein
MTVPGRTESVAASCVERLLTAGADDPSGVLRESIIEGRLNFAQQPVVRTELQLLLVKRTPELKLHSITWLLRQLQYWRIRT